MKVVTIGMSPYNTTSVSRLHASVLKELLFDGHSVMSLSWAHDISYHVPADNGQYYYVFESLPPGIVEGPDSPHEYKIPIVPLRKGLSDPVPIYEALNRLEPDVVITIGELNEASYMKAVKTFASKPFKWLAVMTQSQYPISDELKELADYMDGVLCSSFLARDEIAKFFQKQHLDAVLGDSLDRFVESCELAQHDRADRLQVKLTEKLDSKDGKLIGELIGIFATAANMLTLDQSRYEYIHRGIVAVVERLAKEE